ncbi:hypothetical protein kac65v162_gp189 [Nodularia phage vB_NspS-kac65v162]|jgi:hypothetical protein|uniref:Uncharacterized protein n=3 Tax=Ravarandavirus kac65v151 TaxID=2845689 RepID=A0A482MHH4_9CAUD|nr:hypothetical protein HWC12_gp128 [Nodularia phage vB_NspS-kac65v151]QBQ73219.1 hypothetical protein kac65v151_gp189 [Nodularia phage vB_NspS-kac65v151]QBQ73427.1 hypothetical protein kac65v161_gp189 [Nodularia phage vB_NspS-kac65v161]QBQ73633.1 hypothetical protein kac65v162_gp189 [Nodularia phage vB_NspS-kac65v162]
MALNSKQLYPIGYLPTAPEDDLGVVQPQDGLAVTPEGILTVTPATTTTIGGVIVGDGLSIDPTGLLTSDFNLGRLTYLLTTTAIAPNANLQTFLEIAQDFILLQVATDIPARVRIYNNATYQNSDVTRSLMTEDSNTGVVTANAPSGDHGVLADFVTSGSYLTINTSPVIVIPAIPASAIVPITITNLSATTQVININLLTIKLG